MNYTLTNLENQKSLLQEEESLERRLGRVVIGFG